MSDLKRAEIFSAGTWNGRTFTEEDLDQIVKSFEFFELGGKVPLKLGHNTKQEITDGQPALGWVTSIYREGKRLLADFSDVPSVLYEAIKKALYKFVSIEMSVDVQANTRVVPYVLTAVALIGADIPAVGTLKDLQALTMSKLPGLRDARVLAFRRDDQKTGDKPKMAAKDEDTGDESLEELKARLEKLTRDNEGLKAKVDEGEEYKKSFTKLSSETKEAKVKAHRDAIALLFKQAVDSKRIQVNVRERFYKRFKVDTDDEGVMEISVSDVKSYIDENPNPFLKTSAATASGDPDEITVGGLPDVELKARALRYCRDRNQEVTWQNLQNAATALLRADPSLAERYRDLPADREAGKYGED